MNKLKEIETYGPRGGFKVWIAKIVVGVIILSLWAPLAVSLGITQPWISITFLIGWVVFWLTPYGFRATRVLERMVRREG